MTESDTDRKLRALKQALQSRAEYCTELEEQLDQAHDEIARLREELESGRW